MFNSNKMWSLGAAAKMRHTSKLNSNNMKYNNNHEDNNLNVKISVKNSVRLQSSLKNSNVIFMNVLGIVILLVLNNINQSLAFNNLHNKNSSNHQHGHHHHNHKDFEINGDSNSVLSLVLPHDTYPGYSIKKFTANFTSPNSPYSSLTSYASKPYNYRLLETGFSKYFTVLEDGMVMTTSDLSPLVNRPVHLVVLEETPLATTTHHLQLHIMDRKDMLRFPGAVLESVGEIMENLKRGTRVKNVPLLQANSIKGSKEIVYKIVSGNEDKNFALQNSKTNEISEIVKVSDTKNVGVYLVTNKQLDREVRSDYNLVIEGMDDEQINKVDAHITVKVQDDNDNRPIFTQNQYRFTVSGVKSVDSDGNDTVTFERFTKIGRVQAKDADGDKVAYKLVKPSNYVIIVPQTGELVLAGEPEKNELLLQVEAHDLRHPSLTSMHPAKVLIEFTAPDPVPIIVQHLHDANTQHSHRRDKRRVTRAVRPTKRIDFTEADGDTEGKIVFQLEKETDRETFKIRDENPWVTVEPNGAVRVKKKWDYEELGQEKTIDFWVIITNQGLNGE